jgi:hypothetical protein
MPVDNSNYIYRQGTAPNTRAAISQKNKVFGYSVGASGFQQIGAISEFSFDESRTIDPVRGVGFGDQIAELVPSVTEPMTLTVNKTLLYAANLFQVFGYKGGIDGVARSLRHHRWPFDIKQELVFSEISSRDEASGALVRSASSNKPGSNDGIFDPSAAPMTGTTVRALFTYFEGCWMNSYSASFTSDAAMVAENSSVTVTDILDGVSQYGEFIDTGLAPNKGAAGLGYSLRFPSAGGAIASQIP